MIELSDYIILILLGSLGGFLSGFMGVGGGIIFVPLLNFFLAKMGLHDEALVKGILANSLFTIIFSGSVASWQQYKSGNFYPKEIFNTAITGVFSALFLSYLIRNGSWYSKELFHIVFAIMLLTIVLKMSLKKSVVQELAEAVPFNAKGYRFTGLFSGFITALSGLGGGVIMTPIFTDILKQPIKKATSISNGVIPFLALSVGLYNLSGNNAVQVHQWQIGYIVFPVVLPMIAGALVFTPLGVKISHKVAPQIIRFTFASLVSLIFIKTVYEIFTH